LPEQPARKRGLAKKKKETSKKENFEQNGEAGRTPTRVLTGNPGPESGNKEKREEMGRCVHEKRVGTLGWKRFGR